MRHSPLRSLRNGNFSNKPTYNSRWFTIFRTLLFVWDIPTWIEFNRICQHQVQRAWLLQSSWRVHFNPGLDKDITEFLLRGDTSYAVPLTSIILSVPPAVRYMVGDDSDTCTPAFMKLNIKKQPLWPHRCCFSSSWWKVAMNPGQSWRKVSKVSKLVRKPNNHSRINTAKLPSSCSFSSAGYILGFLQV